MSYYKKFFAHIDRCASHYQNDGWSAQSRWINILNLLGERNFNEHFHYYLTHRDRFDTKELAMEDFMVSIDKGNGLCSDLVRLTPKTVKLKSGREAKRLVYEENNDNRLGYHVDMIFYNMLFEDPCKMFQAFFSRYWDFSSENELVWELVFEKDYRGLPYWSGNYKYLGARKEGGDILSYDQLVEELGENAMTNSLSRLQWLLNTRQNELKEILIWEDINRKAFNFREAILEPEAETA